VISIPCEHQRYSYDQRPAPGGAGIVIVSKCLSGCGKDLTPGELQQLTQRDQLFDLTCQNLKESGRGAVADALKKARENVRSIAGLEAAYTKFQSQVGNAAGAANDLAMLAEIIPDHTWKGLGLPEKRPLLNELEIMRPQLGELVQQLPAYELRALPAPAASRNGTAAYGQVQTNEDQLIERLRRATPDQRRQVYQLIDTILGVAQ
jgi:DNA repair ATPase RecN